MLTNPVDASIVTSTIELAKKLGIVSIAEGVESEAVFTQLEQLGCDRAQGYWIARPATGAEMTDWLPRSQWAAAPVPLRRVTA